MPMPDKGRCKVMEECGELIQAVAVVASMTQGNWGGKDGWGGVEEASGKVEDECADVIAAITFMVKKNGLDAKHIMRRAEEKLRTFHNYDRE